jgi:integrase
MCSSTWTPERCQLISVLTAKLCRLCGIPHNRHTFATWSLAAGISIFTLARRMGTSVKMIDDTYGHLAHDADEQDRSALEAFDFGGRNGNGHVVGTLEPAEGAVE